MATLSLRSITKRFGDHVALDAVDLEVADGELLVLVGPSGCGKSTLLRIAAGLVSADEGEVLLDGRPVGHLPPVARDVAMVFQNYALYPHMTVRRNLAFPLRMAKRPRAEIDERVRRTAEMLGLTVLLDRKPGTLSGGQMQRVALGRAVVRDPRLFLFDEPLSNLDAKLRVEMRAEIAKLHAAAGVTSLYVTHDQAEAMTMGARVCVMDAGRVRQVGPPLEVFEHPADTFVASFLGSPGMNLIRGRAQNGRFTAGELSAPAPPGIEGEVLLGIRPHEAELLPTGPFEVQHVEPLGSHTIATLTVADQPFTLSAPGSPPLACGTRVGIALPPERLHWFDAAMGRRTGGRSS